MPKISDEVRERRRAKILDATVACLSRHGYANTSMRLIADEAGMTKGGLYAYFDSKEAILLAVADRQMQGQLGDLGPSGGEPAREQLEGLFAAYQRTNRDPTVVYTQRAVLDLWDLANELPEVRSALDERYRTYVSTIAGVIRRGQASGEFATAADPKALAALIIAARDGMVVHAVRLGLPVPLVQVTSLLRLLVLKELAPDE